MELSADMAVLIEILSPVIEKAKEILSRRAGEDASFPPTFFVLQRNGIEAFPLSWETPEDKDAAVITMRTLALLASRTEGGLVGIMLITDTRMWTVTADDAAAALNMNREEILALIDREGTDVVKQWVKPVEALCCIIETYRGDCGLTIPYRREGNTVLWGEAQMQPSGWSGRFSNLLPPMPGTHAEA